MVDPERLRAAYCKARDALLAERTPVGHWIGELSSSALSTATAVTALAIVARSAGVNSTHERLIDAGLSWLADHQNADGGWGDTVKSISNISTTMLCRAAFHVTDRAAQFSDVVHRYETWLFERYGRTPQELVEAVRQRYGKDRTFSVPILMMCALAGLVPWKEVPRLPFEMACLPQSWYRFARMPVVSYALPALIAIGQVIHFHRSTWNPITWILRKLGRRRSLRVLERIQPSSGGYLEATPLTSFVVMSLAAMWAAGRYAASGVIAKGVEFIVKSARADGSWPIDTNLSIWVTTLSVNALAAAGDLDSLDRRDELLAWLLKQQLKEVHPYTGAAPGAWGWSDEPGSVPDCDDTPGAVLAVHNLAPDPNRNPASQANIEAQRWVVDLQNRDGGFPTFCRGWGQLPFDRSGCDLTAHAARAVEGMIGDFRPWQGRGLPAAFAYLARQQRSDGSWLPLWFGNQHAPDDINPVYGTTKVLAAYRDLNRIDSDVARRGIAFLLDVQNTDGGWGGAKDTPSSVEETALAVEILVDLAPADRQAAVERGIEYLIRRVEDGTFRDPSPIGFYFAKLWYFEKLYPIIFTVAALGRALRTHASEDR
ncbi:MAG TPA: prenyltransferase/squalene oxidase repeat-containing protein [Gemmataceae bacterium]|jgi:squalene-hopene/tetraprenyl-beta-curcumene cyclase|nr:prenyltransferase/squalene oxidase repeat-containing protein [Gemmataceae bacterium]